jgi:hypothetical protein
LRRVPDVASAAPGEDPGDLRIELHAGTSAEAGSTAVLAALLDVQVPVLSFDLEGGRLSDAYLQLTEAG